MSTNVGASRIRARLDRFPRVRLGAFPSPLVRLERLGRHAGTPIVMKHEDHSLAMGGNKVRLLEFVLGAAMAAGADTLIAGGGRSQSNHGRLCAAAARACGLEPIIFLSEDPTVPPDVRANVLLHFVLGSDLRIVPPDQIRRDAPRFWLQHLMEEEAERVRARGGRPYVLPSASLPLATLGFVAGALELADQLQALGIESAHVVLTSTGATQAGHVLVARALGLPWTVTGVSCAPHDGAKENVARLVDGAAALLDLPVTIEPAEVRSVDRTGNGYGVMDARTLEVMHLVGRLEGVLLDPVYTAKGMLGLLDLASDPETQDVDSFVFIHTGGAPTIFAYAEEIASDGFAARTSAAASIAAQNP